MVSGLPMGPGRVPKCAARVASFRWKAHPVELRSTVVAADRPHSFAIDRRRPGSPRRSRIHDPRCARRAEHASSSATKPRSGRRAAGPGVPRPRLRAANQAMSDDLARGRRSVPRQRRRHTQRDDLVFHQDHHRGRRHDGLAGRLADGLSRQARDGVRRHPGGPGEGQGVPSGVRRALHRAARRHPSADRRHLRSPQLHHATWRRRCAMPI